MTTVAIVGGAFAGLTCGRVLLQSDSSIRVIVIEPRKYFEYTPGILRAFVDPKHFHSIHTPLQQIISSLKNIANDEENVQWIAEFVVEINSQQKRLTLESGKEISFDYCVVAIGSGYPHDIRPPLPAVSDTPTSPSTPSPSPVPMSNDWKDEMGWETRFAAIESMNAALLKSNLQEILIVGGGLVGVELAAEIAESLPSLRITLRQRGTSLLPGLPIGCQRYAAEWLTGHGVHIIYQSDLTVEQCHELISKSGKRYLLFDCTGVKANPAIKIDSSKYSHSFFRVNEFLQIIATDSHSNASSSSTSSTSTASTHVFVVGDCVFNGEKANAASPSFRFDYIRMAYVAELQAQLTAHNIIHMINYEAQEQHTDDIPSLLAYPSGLQPFSFACDYPIPQMVAISLGQKDGLVIFNSLVVRGRLAAWVKNFIEWSKNEQYRGRVWADWLWRVGEPVTFLMNSMWHLFAGCCRKKAKQQ